MKLFYKGVLQHSALTIKTVPWLLLILTFVVLMSRELQAQDPSDEEPSWDTLDSVLVIPPAYMPKSARSEDSRESPSAVAGTANSPETPSAGTADNWADDSTRADVSSADEADSREESPDSGDSQDVDGLETPLGSVEEYEQQAAVAAEFGSYGILPPPLVVFAAPIGLYRNRMFFPSAPAIASTAQPPRPSIVPQARPGTIRSFRSRFLGGFRPGGFPNMHGFHGGFGHR